MKSIRFTKLVSALLALLMVISLAACGGSDGTQTSSVPQSSQATGSTAASATEAPFDTLAKYDPAIEVTTIRRNDPTIKFIDGESFDKNIWQDEYEQRLGIKVKYNWVAPPEQYESKLNISIASDDLPDIIPLCGSTDGAGQRLLKILKDADKIMDITDAYDKYAVDYTKEYLEIDTNSFNSAKINDRLWALISAGSPYNFPSLLWVRTDWLEKLNLPKPETMADVLKISEAFTTKDPDGNNKNDTVGLAITKDLFDGGFAEILGFCNSYRAYPLAWIKDSSGNLVYGSIQPEMKAALKQLQDMYNAGQIDKEFTVKDSGKVAETVTSGKCGMYYGQNWTPLWPLQDMKTKDATVEWQAYPLCSIDGQPANNILTMPVSTYYAINKKMENPEAAFKMLNLDILYKQDKTENEAFSTKVKARYPEDPAIIQKYPVYFEDHALGNILEYLKCKEAFDSNQPLTGSYYESIVKYKAGDNTQWGVFKVFGENGSESIIYDAYKNNLFVADEFYGSPTKTMVEKNAALSKMEDVIYTRIIMNEASIDEFDQFVDNWKKTGGDDITKEVNEWYKAKE